MTASRFHLPVQLLDPDNPLNTEDFDVRNLLLMILSELRTINNHLYSITDEEEEV